MGVLDKFLDAIKLNDDYDEDEFLDDNLLDEADDDEFLDDDGGERPKKNFFQKFSRKKEETDDYDDYDEDEEPVVKPTPKASPKSAAAAAKAEKPARPVASNKITPMRSSRRQGQSANMEVCVIKPTSMEDSREIADTLVDNSTVILNLEGIDVELAQRIIDFTSGACYSLGGTLQKVSSYIFVLGPYNVDITGDLQNILGGSAPSVRAGY
ncbi:MAG: cell division protein SepF [Eubacteriales bacterium]|nr:cell division protein SepF [Eubacteriales bacterium]